MTLNSSAVCHDAVVNGKDLKVLRQSSRHFLVVSEHAKLPPEIGLGGGSGAALVGQAGACSRGQAEDLGDLAVVLHHLD